ncbi:unnamed protein product [Alopecurus aequalis]
MKARPKKPSLGPKGAKVAAGEVKTKKTTSRKKPPPVPAPAAAPPPVEYLVLDGMPTPLTSFMGLLEDAEVDIGAPTLKPFGFGDDLEEEGDEEEEGGDEDEVTEIEEDVFAAVGKPTVRSTNYSEDEDILLVRAWAHVGLDASTGTDQTGSVNSTIAGVLRLSVESEGKTTFLCYRALNRCYLHGFHGVVRFRMPIYTERIGLVNSAYKGSLEGSRGYQGMHGDVSSPERRADVVDQTRQPGKKKKEVKLAQVEARREEAKHKADLEERMIKVKEAKAWKELMVEEKEHMMMSKKDMDEDQLAWCKEYKEDIAERKRILCGASCTLRGDTPVSGGGDGGVEDSTTGDNGGA